MILSQSEMLKHFFAIITATYYNFLTDGNIF